MAMQTGVSSSKVIILLGAGLTGSVILRNGRLSEVIADLQELVKGVNKVEVPSHYNAALLAAQVRQLAQEVRELTLSRPVAIFNGDSASNGNVASYLLPAAAVGAMGYCYMWWKGLSFSDVMFVTKRNMANAVASVSKQLEQVSAALASTKKHLTQRLEGIDDKVEEQKETSKIILHEVNEVKSDLSQIGFDLEQIQQMISGLEGKLGLLEGKQDMTNAGIWYLCQIAGNIKDGINAKLFQDTVTKLALDKSTVFSEEISSKGLQFLAGSLSPEGENNPKLKRTEKPNNATPKDCDGKSPKSVSMQTSAIHRSFPRGISVAGLL